MGKACQGYIPRILLLKADLAKKRIKYMKYKMDKKIQMESKALQIKSVWKAKIEYIISNTTPIMELTEMIKMNMSTCLHIHSEQWIILCIRHAKVWWNSVIIQRQMVLMMPYMGETT